MTGDFDSSQRLDRSWDVNAEAWTATVRQHRIESRRVATDRAIVEAVLRRSPSTVLDVGCGEGWLCRELGGVGIRCTGVDGSSGLIDAAREADHEGQYHLLSYADVESLEEFSRAGRFDVAVCNFSLLHQDIRPILDIVRRVVRPGGIVLIQTVHPWAACGDAPYVDGWRNEDFAWSELPFPEPMPWYFRTLESWTRILSDSDLLLDTISEPRHPEGGRPLSLLLSAIRPGVQRSVGTDGSVGSQ